jgi:hypothetical protein
MANPDAPVAGLLVARCMLELMRIHLMRTDIEPDFHAVVALAKAGLVTRGSSLVKPCLTDNGIDLVNRLVIEMDDAL